MFVNLLQYGYCIELHSCLNALRNYRSRRHFDGRREEKFREGRDLSLSGRDDKEGHVGGMRKQMFCRPAGTGATGPARLFAPRASLLHRKQSYFLGLYANCLFL